MFANKRRLHGCISALHFGVAVGAGCCTTNRALFINGGRIPLACIDYGVSESAAAAIVQAAQLLPPLIVNNGTT